VDIVFLLQLGPGRVAQPGARHGLRVAARGGRWPGQDCWVMFAPTMTPPLTV